MRLIKAFLFVAAGLFVLVTLISLLIPSRVMTVESVTIHASQAKITGQVSDLQQWKNWHPVFKTSPAGISYSQPSDVAGAYVEWGKADKKNRLTIKEIVPGGIHLVLARPGETSVENSILLLPVEEAGTFHVEWRSLTRLKWYPWEKFAGIFVGDITGPGYQLALNELKKFVEVAQ